MVFHEDLAKLGEKENLKERKLSKAVESFTWNITVLKVPAFPFIIFTYSPNLFRGRNATRPFSSVLFMVFALVE